VVELSLCPRLRMTPAAPRRRSNVLPPTLIEFLQTVTAMALGIAGSSVEVPDNQGRTTAKSISFAKEPIPIANSSPAWQHAIACQRSTAIGTSPRVEA
jgi:hypothetical protein